MAKYKVYISSTYRDLKEHRQEVIEFFEKKTIKEVFDLTSMEGYVADNEVPALECIEDVKQCDIYILILANRYGYIPPDIALNPERLSITELEYNAATADSDKTILAFFADEGDPKFEYDNDADENLLAEKKQKLQAFKNHIRETRLTHPEPFITSFHLALQIAESLMRKSFIAYKLEDARKYCCDRVAQYTQYLQMRGRGRFHSVIIYGSSSELGINLINRLGIFTLSVTDTYIAPPINFEEILVSDEYETCKTILLGSYYAKLFNTDYNEDKSLSYFLAACGKLDKPLVILINCDIEFFEERQAAFIKQFMEELYSESSKQQGQQIYIFINFQENTPAATTDLKIKQLQQSLSNQQKYLTVLPRLQPLSPALIRNWLFTYVSPDQGRVEDLMEKVFKNLSATLSMREADRKIREFIQRLNNHDAEIFDIIH